MQPLFPERSQTTDIDGIFRVTSDMGIKRLCRWQYMQKMGIGERYVVVDVIVILTAEVCVHTVLTHTQKHPIYLFINVVIH